MCIFDYFISIGTFNTVFRREWYAYINTEVINGIRVICNDDVGTEFGWWENFVNCEFSILNVRFFYYIVLYDVMSINFLGV